MGKDGKGWGLGCCLVVLVDEERAGSPLDADADRGKMPSDCVEGRLRTEKIVYVCPARHWVDVI